MIFHAGQKMLLCLRYKMGFYFQIRPYIETSENILQVKNVEWHLPFGCAENIISILRI